MRRLPLALGPIVADIAVKESQRVDKGQVLFTLDQEPFRIALAGADANLGIVRNQLVTLQATEAGDRSRRRSRRRVRRRYSSGDTRIV